MLSIAIVVVAGAHGKEMPAALLATAAQQHRPLVARCVPEPRTAQFWYRDT